MVIQSACGYHAKALKRGCLVIMLVGTLNLPQKELWKLYDIQKRSLTEKDITFQ